MPFQTEYPFTLPKGYVDQTGALQREGIMRLATAGDEINSMRDPRVQQNPGYLTVMVLSRVIVRLGDRAELTPELVEGLFAADLAFLNDMYERINGPEQAETETVCPQCGCRHMVPLNFTRGA